MYDSTKGDINNREVNVTFNCFPITGNNVDRAARALLQDITGVDVSVDNAGNPKYDNTKFADAKGKGFATLDSTNYNWGVMDKKSASFIQSLVDARNAVPDNNPYAG